MSRDDRRRVLVLDGAKRRFRQVAPAFADSCDFRTVDAVDAAPGSGPDLLREVAAAMQREDFTHVVATSESNMLKAAFIRSSFGLPGPGFEEILPVTDKWRMKQAVRGRVPAARGWSSSTVAAGRADLPGRVVVKPTLSSSARGVELLDAGAAVRRMRQEHSMWLVEEVVAVRRELHCDGVLRAGRVVWSCVSAYDRPVIEATGSRGSLHLAPDDPLAAAADVVVRQAFDALPVRDGVFHLELFVDDAGNMIFGEVALRPAGGGVATSIGSVTGVDLWEHFVAAQVGLDRPAPTGGVPPGRWAGVLMIRQDSAHGPDEVAALPGVVRLEAGNMRAGSAAAHSCDCSHYVYFDAGSRADFDRITDAVGGVRFS